MHDFELVDENIKWYGKEAETEQTPMHDTGKGEPVVLRFFEFNFPPDIKELPTKEQILTPEYIKNLKVQLWADELRMVLEPRVSIDKKGFKVCVACQAKTGSSFLDKPRLLQEWTTTH